MSDRPAPETEEAWDAVSRLPSGMYDSRVSILAYATAMSDHSRKMERQRDEWKSIAKEALMSFRCTQRPEIYPEGHWSRRAQGLLGGHAIAAVKGGEG